MLVYAYIFVSLSVIHSIRFLSVWILENKFAFMSFESKRSFHVNQILLAVELVFVFLVIANLMVSQLLSNDLLLNIIVITIIHLLLEIPMLITLNKMNSFFYIGEEYIEFNLSLGNRAEDTVRIDRKNMRSIGRVGNIYLLQFIDGSEIKIKISNLVLLTGFKVLMEKLDS